MPTNLPEDRSKNLKSTHLRGSSWPDHRPPSGRHAGGRLNGVRWLGTSRVVDRGARRRAQRTSWLAGKAQARREVMAAKPVAE